MIPRINKDLRLGIEGATYEDPNWTNSALARCIARTRRNLKKPGGWIKLIFSMVGLLILLAILAYFIFGALPTIFTGIRNQLFEPHTLTPLQVPIAISAIGAVLTAFAFFMFAGGPDKRLHRISLSYPIPDVSFRRFVKLRTSLACLVLFPLSLIWYVALAGIFDLVPLQLWPAIGFAAIQTLFAVSLALNYFRLFEPTFDFAVWACGFAVPITLLFISFGCQSEGDRFLFGYPAEIVDSDLTLIHQWITSVFYVPGWIGNVPWIISEGGPGSSLAAGTISLVVGVVIFYGAKSYCQLSEMLPSKSLDGDVESALQVASEDDVTFEEIGDAQLSGSHKVEFLADVDDENVDDENVDDENNDEDEYGEYRYESTEETIIARIDQILKPPQTRRERWYSKSLPRPDWLRYVCDKRDRFDAYDNTNVLVEAKRVLKNTHKHAGSLASSILGLTIVWGAIACGIGIAAMIIVAWFNACFRSPDDAGAQFAALVTCAAISAIAVLRAMPVFRQSNSTYLYPVDSRTFSQTAAKLWWRGLLSVVPYLAILNVVFCWYYGFDAYQAVTFVYRPIVLSLALMIVLTGFQFAAGPKSIWLRVPSLAIFAIWFCCLALPVIGLLAPLGETLTTIFPEWNIHVVHISLVATVALLGGLVLNYFALNRLAHSKWADIGPARNTYSKNGNMH